MLRQNTVKGTELGIKSEHSGRFGFLFSLKVIASSILLFLYRALLDISYIGFVHPNYSHKAFELSYGPREIIGSYLVLFLVYAFIPKNSERFSYIGLQVLFLVGFVPITSFFAMGQGGLIWFFMSTAFFLVLTLITRLLASWSLPSRERSRSPLISEYDLGALLLILPVASLLLIGYYKGLLFNLDLSRIYSIREEYVEVQNKVLFGGYFMNWAGRIAIPFMFLIACFGRRGIKWGLLLTSIVLLLLMFSVSGHKSYLLLPFMAVGGGVLVRNGHFFRDLLCVLSLLVLASFLYFMLGGGGFPGALLIKRLLFLPAQLAWFYYEHFQETFLYLSHSIFKGLVVYPLEMSHPHLIAEKYLGTGSYANNGVFSDGFKNFGILGVFIWSCLLGGLLKICDEFSKNKNQPVTWGLLLTGVYTLINGQLFPVLLTHGFLLSLVIVLLYPEKSKNEVS